MPDGSGGGAPATSRAHAAGPQRAPARAGALAVAVALLAPSAWWVARDRAVWSWDPAFYAMDTLDLWSCLAQSPRQWLERMTTIYHAKAPGIAWLGQLFVPLGRAVGSIELGLLLSVLLAQLAALALVHRLAKRIAPASRGPALAGTLLVAASPLFVAMSHHFLTEALQLFAVAYVLWAAANAAAAPPLRTLLHLLLAGLVGVSAKLSTPAYVVFPALLAALEALRALRRGARPRPGGRDVALALAVLAVGGFALAWYRRNGAEVLAFAKLAATSDLALEYGSRGPLATKLAYWLGAIGTNLFAPLGAGILVAVGAVAAAVVLRRAAGASLAARRTRGEEPRGGGGAPRTAPGSGRLAAAALLQVALVLVMMSRTVNEETRYLLPLAPMLAVVLVWLLAELGSGPALAVALAVLAVQWGAVHARQLGVLPGPARTYWERAPDPSDARRRELRALVEATCDERAAGRWSLVGVNLDWLNHYTLMFHERQVQLGRPVRCYYDYLGHAPRDPDAALRRIGEADGPYFVSLEETAMPQPPDYLNRISADVLRRVERDPRFARVPFANRSGLVVFRRGAAAEVRR